MQRNHQRPRLLALLLLIVLITGLTAALSLLFTASRIQADDTGWHGPGSDNATSGDGFEINPTYAYADDNVSAENHGGLGDSHLFRDFGLSVPAGATIEGIQLRLDWYLDSIVGTSSMGADLSWDGGDNWTSQLSDTVQSTVEHTAYLGGSSDNWGHAWSPNEIADADFRVRITCNSDTAGMVFYLEYVSVIVYYSPVHHLAVTGNSSMTAGDSNVLTITAIDTLGNVAVNYDGLKSLTFSGPGQAPGGQLPTVGGTSVGNPVSVSFANGVSDNATATTLVAYRSETTTVHVTDGISDSYTNGSYGLGLTVNAGAASYIVISPDSAAIAAGNTQSYTAQSFDQFDNPIGDVTSTTTFTADVAAGGSWTNNTYTSEKAGTWNVTGTYSGLSDLASLDVTASSASYIVISPDSAAIAAGNTQSYTAQSFDQFDNPIGDVTSTTTFTADVAAGGSWTNNTYTSEKAGTWNVTGTYSALSDLASLDVTASSASYIVISPDSAAIAAGNTQSYTAQSFDQFGNPVTDVTAGTTFSITTAAGGSWSTNVYTSEKAGTWTVTGTFSTFTDDASLTVGSGPLHHIIISPDVATVNAGDTQAYTSQSIDQFDNPIADVSSSTTFSIEAGAGGSWASNVYTSSNAGTWTVTGNYLGLIDTASLTVSTGSLHHIVISPDTSTIAAGGSQSYAAEAFDQTGNTLGDVTSTTSFSADVGAGGSWAGNVYTSAIAGTWIVTGTHSGVSDTASLTVNAGAPDHIVISPGSATIVAGNAQTYTAQSFDLFNNPIADVTGSTTFGILEGGHGGTWVNNIYTSAATGTWTVRGTFSGLTDDASLTVNAGAPSYIVISPGTATITAGAAQIYSAQSFDGFDNLIADISTSTVFTITSGAGGGWNSNIYTSANTGAWTVTGTYIGLTDTASLTVNAGALHHIVISPDTSTITAGSTQTYSAQSFDQFNNLIANVTSSTTFSILEAGHGGSWAANVYTSASVGTWTVRGVYSTVSDTAILTVNVGTLHHIVISPDTATVTAGNSQAYTAQSFDQFNNLIADVTGTTTFSILEAGHGGAWVDNIYTSAATGTWTVRGTFSGLTDDASLTVTISDVVRIEISPIASTVTAGGAQTYTVLAYDNIDNSADVSAATTFSIDAAAGGSWVNYVYTSEYAGTWTITATYLGFNDTASLTVNASALHHIVISPDTSTITAGSTQTYSAQSFDQFNNLIANVTSSTTFSILEAGHGGSWATNVYTSQTAGTWTVTGIYLSTYSDIATLTVNAGALHHIVISPDSAAVIAGNPQTYTAQAFDQFNNLIADVTSTTSFSIDVGAGGSWDLNVYTSASIGTWIVTGTYSTVSDTASLTVSGGPLQHIVISPDSAAVIAGNMQAYTAQSFDQFNNPIADITGTTAFSIDVAAGGSWIANVYVSAKAGTWTVSGNYGGLIDTASLVVSAGALHHIVISPDITTIMAGGTQTYTAEAFDQFDNTLGDVTAVTGFSIDAAAGGTWTANVYTSATAGTWTVTGTYSGLTDTASLTVGVGSVDRIIITPDGATIAAGSSQTYTAQTADQFGNPITDVTSSTVFTIDSGAGGTWAASVYTSASAGTWTVSGDYGGLIGTAVLNVTTASVSYIVISPDGATVTAGNNQTYTAQSFDEFGNLVADVTGTTVFSIDAGAEGTWTANVYTSANAGTWTVTGDCVGLTDNTSLIVSAGARHHIVISPDTATITAGSTQAYTAAAFDQFDNTLGDVTSGTTFSIESGAGGSWSANIYTSRITGTWTVTGTDNTSLSDTAVLTVNAGAVDHYMVTSDNYSQETTIAFTVTVTAYDQFGNQAAADNISVTMISTSSGLVFDGNGNGTFGEAGDDTGTLVLGTLEIQAKAKSSGEDVIITASDGTRIGISEPYSIGDFRCFIATAAYGTPMIDQIQVLRDFRDQYLMKTPAGRWFVSTYYRYSPPPARFIARHDSLRAFVRFVLTPIIWLTNLFMNTTLLQKIALLALVLAAVAAATLWLSRLRRHMTA